MTISPITNSPTIHKHSKMKDFWHGFNTALIWIGSVGLVLAAVLVVTSQISFTRVLSNSMAPSFHRGDVLLVKPYAKTELRQGQVVLLPNVDKDGSQYVHRLISVVIAGNQVKVETKGDANRTKDPWELNINSNKVPLVFGQLPTANLPFVELSRNQIVLFAGLLFVFFIALFVPSKAFVPSRAFVHLPRHSHGRHRPHSSI